VPGGAPLTVTATLTCSAKKAQTITLKSFAGTRVPAALLTVPLSVTIQAGQSSVTFPIATVAVTSDSPVTVIASHNVSDQVADSVTSNTIDVTP
jgi:hypothetical protein